MIAVDGEGGIRDGDELIALCARHLADAGRLDGGVVVTVMSNYGFHRAMADAGIEVATTPVGDRHVAAELERRGWTLGGEQSGHIIWEELGPTGDGIAASLCWPCARSAEPTLAEAIPMQKLPQVLENVEIARSWRRRALGARFGRRSSARARRSRGAAASSSGHREPSLWSG